MATIYNSDLSKELVSGAKIQQATDRIPNILGDVVIPTMEVNPKLLRRINHSTYAAVTNATSGTIYTTPADKDYFLTAISLSVIKDVTSTSVLVTLRCIQDGLTKVLLAIPCITLTVQNQGLSLTLPYPMKIDKNTAITVTSSTNVANIVIVGTVMGYTTENSNA